MTRALVTGAAGFLGRHVVRALAERGLDVVALERPGAAPRPGPGGQVVVEQVELGAAGAVAGVLYRHRPEVLVHLAWYARPDDYLTSRENLRSLTATVGLVEAAVDAGCRRILGVGSCLECAASDQPHREADAAAPDTLYAAAKHAARLVCERLAEGHASFAWARVFHLHGPGEDERRLVPMVAERLRRGEPVAVSPGEQVRDYLRVEDAADALAALALSDVTGTAQVCSGRGLTLRQLLGAVGEALGRPELIRFGAVPYRAGERMRIEGEPTALRRLGWRPRWSELPPALAYLRGEGR